MNATLQEINLEELNHLSATELLTWAATAHGERAAIITSFQKTGCIMIDMAYRAGINLRVITIDTLRLHPDTYDLMDRIEKRYGIMVERFQPNPDRLEQMIRNHGEFLFFDSKDKQKYCCEIRKVEPNARALQSVDVWITGLRRDQSAERKDTPKVSIVKRHNRPIIRLCPIVDWQEEALDAYIAEHEVPRNALYDKGYTTIGCEICSTPNLPHEEKRAGRWRWFNYLGKEQSKECGIHNNGSGI